MKRAAGSADLLKQVEAELGFVGVYIIGPRSGYPTIFGVASRPGDAYNAIKRGHWELHQVHAFAWTPGRPAALRLKEKLAERLAAKQSFENPEWYDASVAEVLGHLEDIARLERVELFDDVEHQRRIEKGVQAFLNRTVAPFERPRPRLVKG